MQPRETYIIHPTYIRQQRFLQQDLFTKTNDICISVGIDYLSMPWRQW